MRHSLCFLFIASDDGEVVHHVRARRPEKRFTARIDERRGQNRGDVKQELSRDDRPSSPVI